jgi:signal transduction histidine kinase
MRWNRRAVVLATALGIAVFQVVGSFGAADNQPERKEIDALALALVLVGPAMLAVRDRHPRTTLVVTIGSVLVYIGSGYPYGPIFVSLVVAFYNAVMVGQRRFAWGMAVAGYAGFVAAYAVDPRAEGTGWLHWTLVAGWLVVVLSVSELDRVRRQQRVERARAEHEEQERRAGEQRLGLAQELHDVLAHNISMINVQASVALHLLDDQPDQARPALAAIKDASHDALHELRAALEVLRQGDGSAPLGPAPALHELEVLLDGWRASGLDVRLDQTGQRPALPSAVELAAYCIVQEALTNVSRHAGARSAVVRIGYDDTAVTIEVSDDGVGGPAGAGMGIAGMRERAASLGGELEAGPRPEGGFEVRARLPVAAA